MRKLLGTTLTLLLLLTGIFVAATEVQAGNGVFCPVGRSCLGIPIDGAMQCELSTDPVNLEGPDYWCCPEGFIANGLDRKCFDATTDSDFDPTAPITNDTFNALNPLVQFGDPVTNLELNTPGGIISRALQYLFPIAGLILFVILLWSGFEMIAGAENPKAQEAGSQRAGAAVIGLVLLFVSYWVIRLIEVITGAKIF